MKNQSDVTAGVWGEVFTSPGQPGVTAGRLEGPIRVAAEASVSMSELLWPHQ